MSLAFFRSRSLGGLVLLIIGIVGLTWWVRREITAKPTRQSPPPPDAALLMAHSERIKPLHTVKGKPQPGDWLASHKESGQTFKQYLISRRSPLCDEYQTLYIQPFGKFTKAQTRLVKATCDFLGRFYSVPVKELPALSLEELSDDDQRVDKQGNRQLLTRYFLDVALPKVREEDAIAVLGLTAEDLWPGEGWNFVFGQASLTERVGIWSIARFGDPDGGDEAYQLCLRRTLGTAVHETGHMLGIPHCIAYECCMNGSNSLPESDRGQLWFCPECEPKIWWTCRADPRKRYQSLVEFAKEHDMEAEAVFWQKSLNAIPEGKVKP